MDPSTYSIIEWMVRRPYRGTGIGRRLLDTLLGDRREPWAVLASNPNSAARNIYDHLGWTLCGKSKPNKWPTMDLLALRLAAKG